MLFTFKSATQADLIMHEKNGKDILALLGKSPDDVRGIITVEQLTAAIATLKKAIAADKAITQESTAKASKNTPDDEPTVNLAQRATPLIGMLERAVKAREPVTWGV